MKRTVSRLLLLAVLAALPLAALDVPALKGRVNDYANMLKPVTVATLESRLAELETSDSTQIAVLTVPSLEGEVLEEYSMKVAETWKIGRKKLDNGAILLIARDDRKMRIEVGYGLEGKLTDLRAGRITDEIMRPAFKAGDYDRGVTDGVDAMIQAVRGEYSAVDAPAREKKAKDFSGFAVPGLFAFFFIGIIGKIKRVLGGVAGAVIAPIVGLLGMGMNLFLLALIPLGFLAGMIIPTLMTIFMMSGGGSRGGFGGSSGGGGGGFSGGGGSFGGGGSSGSW